MIKVLSLPCKSFPDSGPKCLYHTADDMIYILHDLKDPKRRRIMGMFLRMGNAGFISTVGGDQGLSQ